MCGNASDAEDAAQEAFVRAYARWRRLEKEEWAGAWVTTTALNVLRRRARRREPIPPETQTAPGPPNALRVDLLDAMRSLPPRQRQAAALFYVADLPVAVVARSMGLSEGAVKAHLSRARDALRARLGEDHG